MYQNTNTELQNTKNTTLQITYKLILCRQGGEPSKRGRQAMLTSKHFLRGSGTKIHKYSSSKGQIQTKKELNTVYLLKAKRTANSVNKKALSTR